jgi:hypothetical protein
MTRSPPCCGTISGRLRPCHNKLLSPGMKKEVLGYSQTVGCTPNKNVRENGPFLLNLPSAPFCQEDCSTTEQTRKPLQSTKSLKSAVQPADENKGLTMGRWWQMRVGCGKGSLAVADLCPLCHNHCGKQRLLPRLICHSGKPDGVQPCSADHRKRGDVAQHRAGKVQRSP